MKILQSNINKGIILNNETDFKTDLGWEESFQEFEQDTLKSIINPAVNFETVRYIHNSCTGGTGNIDQSDIWFYFYFYNNDNPKTHAGGLNYEYVGLTPELNSKVLRENNESFFRLEFYKIPDGELPNSSNRKLVFTKHLPVALGERVLYTPTHERIFVPVFTGNNYRNKENMYLFWFQDTTVLAGTLFSGDTFYMTARFFNTVDGKILTFTNNDKPYGASINEETDVYYKMVIDRSDYSYTMYSGDTRIGCSTNPIRFYAGGGSSSTIIYPSPSQSVSVTPSISLSPLPPSRTPSITVTPSITPSRMPQPVTITNITNPVTPYGYGIVMVTVNGSDVLDVAYNVAPGEQKVGSTIQLGDSYNVVVEISGVSYGQSINVNGECITTNYQNIITFTGINTRGGILIYYSDIAC